MSGSYFSRLPGGSGLGATTVLAAKVAFVSAVLAVAASLARMPLPQLVSGAGADGFLWKLYLFVTVHVIIFVIWKLSDNKHFDADAQQHKDPSPPSSHNPAPPLLTEEVVLFATKSEVEFVPAAARAEEHRVVAEGILSPGSSGGESCVTTISEEDAPSAAADSMWSLAPAPPPPPPAVAATAENLDDADHDDGGGDDDLDATWNAIMQKMRPPTAPALYSSPQAPRSRQSARRS